MSPMTSVPQSRVHHGPIEVVHAECGQVPGKQIHYLSGHVLDRS